LSKPRMTRRQRRWYDEVISCLKNPPTQEFSQYFWAPHNVRVQYSWAWGAYFCAKKYGSRADIDLKKLQLITLRYGCAKQLYKYAKDIPGANIKRFQRAIVETGEYKYVKMFHDNVPGANQAYLENMLIVMEVMDF
jgi:hypothetical protein